MEMIKRIKLRYFLNIFLVLFVLLTFNSSNLFAQLSGPNELCFISDRSMEFHYANATADCEWSFSGLEGATLIVSGEYNSTVVVQFSVLSNSETPPSGSISVSMGGVDVGTSAIKVLGKAAPAGGIEADGGVFCENVSHDFRIAEDPTNYGSPLKYDWRVKGSGFDAEAAYGGSNLLPLLVIADYGKASLIAQPRTCESTWTPGYSTVQSIKQITPFVYRTIYKGQTEIEIHPIRRLTTGDWSPLTRSVDYACSFYSFDFNSSVLNAVGTTGQGDGYLYLQAGVYAPANPVNKGEIITYEWTFDPTQLTIDTAKIVTSAYQEQDFGYDKQRIVFRVLPTATDTEILVKVKAICGECRDKASIQGSLALKDFTLEGEKVFRRLDSIKEFEDYTFVSESTETGSVVCAGKENKFAINNQDPLAFKNSNAEFYRFDNIPQEWELISQDTFSAVYLTRRVDKRPIAGTDIKIRVYPQNSCFLNGNDTSRNGKEVNVYLRNAPLEPIVTDPSIGEVYAPHYTERKLEDLQMQENGTILPIILLCNYNDQITLPQDFLLFNENDTIKAHGYTFIDELDGFTKLIESTDTRRFENQGNDSSIFRIVIREPSRDIQANKNLVKIGFKAENVCASGDTGIYYVRIIDTLAVTNPIERLGGGTYDTIICEGIELSLSTLNGYDDGKSNAQVTDRVEYQWTVDSTGGWTILDDSEESFNVKIRVGEKTAKVAVQFRNKCGISTKRMSDKITVRPFTRVKIGLDTVPCQGNTVTYSVDTVDGTQGYKWIFPTDWEVTPPPGDTLNSNEQITTNLQAVDSGSESMQVTVKVGADDGSIYVIGRKDSCNFTYDNYKTVHRADSLKVSSKNFTLKPEKDVAGYWTDTLCARSNIELIVKPHTNSEDKDSVYFSWIFTNDKWKDGIGYSAKKDTAWINVIDTIDIEDSIKIISHRVDCNETNIGDTLVYKFVVMDTVPIVPPFLDLYDIGSTSLNKTPCEGDTVLYYINKATQNQSIYNIVWEWNEGNAIVTGDSLIDNTGWIVLSDAPYYDSLELIVGRSKLRISAAVRNICGISKAYADTIQPKFLIRDSLKFTTFEDSLCNNEELSFAHEGATNATYYIWNYPWGAQRDTVHDSVGYTRVFDEAYTLGNIYITPYNSCGLGPTSDTIKITDTLSPPTKPSLVDFMGLYDPARDTAFDTICLRTNIELKAKYLGADADKYEWRYDWSLISGDVADILAITDVPNDSLSSFRKNVFENPALIAVAARHDKCLTYGDSVFISFSSLDTLSIPSGKIIDDYIVDLETGSRIQPRPCGNDSVKYVFNYTDLHWSALEYEFIWDGAQEYSINDSTMAGKEFKLLSIPPVDSAFDTLHMSVPNGQNLIIGVKANNMCGESTLLKVDISTASSLDTTFTSLHLKSSSICNNEELKFKLDTIEDAGYYVWYYPWGAKTDTSAFVSRSFIDNFDTGYVYVIPVNGCGPAPNSDSIRIGKEDILNVPQRLQPSNFAFSYDVIRDTAIDTVCMRTPFVLGVKDTGSMANYAIEWTLLKGSAVGFDPSNTPDSLCTITQAHLDSATYTIAVAARNKQCKLYGDSLIIELFPMDTISFGIASDIATYKMALDSIVLDRENNFEPLSLTPCGYTEVAYFIDAAKLNWSVDSTWFSWYGLTQPNLGDSLMGSTQWKNINPDLLPDTLNMLVANIDILKLDMHFRNACGTSDGQIEIKPTSAVVDTAKINLDFTGLCIGEEIEVSVDSLPFATNYVWITPWKTDTLTERTYKFTLESNSDLGLRVYGYNACGNGAFSKLVELDSILEVPEIPTPLWRESLVVNNDTVVDSICVYTAGLELKVKSEVNDTNSEIIYDWQVITGNIEISEDGSPTDSCTIKPKDGVAVAGENGLLMVSSKLKNCNTYSDTLFIQIKIIDTATTASLGSIIYVDPAVFEERACPGSTIKLKVQNADVSPAYKWILPTDDETWEFAENTDTTAAEVSIIVGVGNAMIMVAPITDASMAYCQYYSSSPISTKEYKPHTPLQTEGLVDGFNITPCVGSIVQYEVKPTPGAKGYKWEFPSGWEVKSTNLEEMLNDSTLLHVGTEVTCDVLVGQDSGYVKVWAFDSCGDDYIVFGSEISNLLKPVDTVRLSLITDIDVCFDSTTTITVIASNEFLDGYFDLEINYLGDDPTPVEVVFPNAPDSSIMEVGCFNSDSVEFIFTSRHTLCPNNVHILKHYILADTIPDIPGIISGDTLACAGAFKWFTAKADMDIGDGAVSYMWELPQGVNWQAVTALDSSSVYVRVGNFDGGITPEIIKCYPRAICGTAEAYEFEVTVNKPDEFENEIFVFANDTSPCIGTNINVKLLSVDAYGADYKFFWLGPDSWTKLSIDSSTTASFTVGLDSENNLEVRFLREGSCGLSEPLKRKIYVRDSAETAKLKTSSFPCMNNETFTFVLADSLYADIATWILPSGFIDYDLFTTSNIKNDSIIVQNPTATSLFNIRVITSNECGKRDTIIKIEAVAPLANFDKEIGITRFCVEDTAYAYMKIPQNHLNKDATYGWVIDERYEILEISIDNDDSISFVRFKTDELLDTLLIKVSAKNNCGNIDTVQKKIASYSYSLIAKPEKDTVLYMTEGIGLLIDSVEFETIEDYTYIWFPKELVTIVENAVVNSKFKTGKLVEQTETFYLTAREKYIDTTGIKPVYVNSLCYAYDTISIFVDGTFAFTVDPIDTVCVDADAFIVAKPYGGNADKYFFEWYVENNDVFERLEGEGKDTLVETIDDFHKRFMLIAYDSTYLYSGDDLLKQFSVRDTQYVDVFAYELFVDLLQPGKADIEVPIGVKLNLEAEAREGTGAYVYLWSPASLFTNTSDTTQTTVRTKSIYTDSEILLTVKDTVSGCLSEVKIRLTMSDIFDNIPNAFSPNGDGINDIFMKGVDLIIYNRLGLELFKSTNKEGWDGTYNGKTIAKGDYLYVISIEGEDGRKHVNKGVVSVF